MSRLSEPARMTMDWQGTPASPSSCTIKRTLRLDIPADAYPNFNFVGRLLGPRGNSLKRVELSFYWRPCVYYREMFRDESQDYIKREQLRELALLNSNFRENRPGPSGSVSPFNTSLMKQESPGPSGGVSPFNTIGMKRAKTGR